eukprot:gene20566-26671_t
MSFCSRELKEFLGEIGACELVVFACTMHIGDENVSEYGSSAIGLLANNNISNSYRLAEVDACECMAQIAFTQLCEAANASKLYECGANELVVNLLRMHISKPEFIPSAIRSLCSLASLNNDHRESLGRIGACQLVVKVLSKDDRILVMQDCCECLMHLSLCDYNNKQLSELIISSQSDLQSSINVCQLILERLDKYLVSQDFGAEICTGALLNLLTIGDNKLIDKNKLNITSSDGAIILKQTQHSPKCSYRAKENIIKLLDLIGVSNDITSYSSKPLITHSSNNSNNNRNNNSNNNSNKNSDKNIVSNESIKPLNVDVLEYVEFRRMSSFGSVGALDDEFKSNPKYSRIQRKKSYKVESRNGIFEI